MTPFILAESLDMRPFESDTLRGPSFNWSWKGQSNLHSIGDESTHGCRFAGRYRVKSMVGSEVECFFQVQASLDEDLSQIDQEADLRANLF